MSTKKHIFSSLERKCFVDILKKYSSVIENKQTDGASLRTKNEAWDKITREYNSSPHATIQVTHKQLRRLWMNLKQRQRESITKEKQHRLATGGGPSTSDAVIDPDVAEIAPALIVGIDEAIDSDTLLESVEIIETEEIPSAQFTSTPSTSTIEPPQLILLNSQSTSIVSQSQALPTSTIEPPQATITQSTPPRNSTPPPTHLTPLPQSSTLQGKKNTVIEKEYKDRLRRAEELHKLEIELMRHRIREAKAKADLTEYILQQKRSANVPVDEEGNK